MTPTYADVLAAAPLVHRYVTPTPLYEWPALSRLLGCRYFLKHENHTPTTAFKVRGGINWCRACPKSRNAAASSAARPATTASRWPTPAGCLASAACWSCRRSTTPTRSRPCGSWGQRSSSTAGISTRPATTARPSDSAKGCATSIRPTNRDLIAGVGTYALEIFDGLPDPDVVLVPVGLGSGICGTALVAAERRPQTRRHRRAIGRWPRRSRYPAQGRNGGDRHAAHFR